MSLNKMLNDILRIFKSLIIINHALFLNFISHSFTVATHYVGTRDYRIRYKYSYFYEYL